MYRLVYTMLQSSYTNVKSINRYPHDIRTEYMHTYRAYRRAMFIHIVKHVNHIIHIY